MDKRTKLCTAEMRSHPTKAERRKIIRKAALELPMYILFLTTMIIMAICSHDDAMFNFIEVNNKHFLLSKNKFEDIVTREEWWDYIKDINQMEFTTDPYFVMEENLFLGTPRLRQLRVRPDTCEVFDTFRWDFFSCYGLFSAANEQRDPEYKGTNYLKPSRFDVLHKNEITPLTDGGYVQDLTFNVTENVEIIERLIETKWFDDATRLIVLEFTFFSDNTKLLNNFKLAAEIPAIGGLIPDIHRSVINVYSFWTTPNNYFIWFVCVVFNCCLMYKIYEEVKELTSVRWKYFCVIWNYFDLLACVLSWLGVFYQFWHGWYVQKLMKQFEDNPNKFVNIDTLSYFHSISFDVSAIIIFFQCLRVFKYFDFSETLAQFTVTVVRCGKDILAFSLMLAIVLFAYAVAGMILFCSYLPEFKDLKSAMLTLIKMIIGHIDYSKLEMTSPVVGPIYYITYILVLFFVFDTLILAIMANIYLNLKHEMRSGKTQLTSFLPISVKRTLGDCRDRICPTRAQKEPEPSGSDGGEKQRRFSPLMENFFHVPSQAISFTSSIYQEHYAEVARLNSELEEVEERIQELISNIQTVLGKKHELFSEKESFRNLKR